MLRYPIYVEQCEHKTVNNLTRNIPDRVGKRPMIICYQLFES